MMWDAAGASTIKSFEAHMLKIKEVDEGAYDWMIKQEPKTWARCFFSPHAKCDAIHNNISESFNSYIKQGRDMPILSMLEWIRKRLMKRIHVKYNGMLKYRGNICPNVQDKLELLKIESRNYFCTPAGNLKYEVDYYNTQCSVNLGDRTCTCRMWDLNGIPCRHAISAIYANRQVPEDFVHKFFFKQTYLGVYKHVISPIPSKDEWERTEFPDIIPNIPRKPAGRPKKKRIRSCEEPINPYKVSRSGGFVVCGNYGQKGHNVRGYKAGIMGETAWQKRMRVKNKQGNQVGCFNKH